MNAIRSSIQKVAELQDLSEEKARKSMREIMSGKATPSQIGAFLTALRYKGETVQEIASFAKVMRKFATQLNPDVEDIMVDTCGTGGDEINTINISTGAMFVAAGAGVLIAKHGNRSVTSNSGSADVLEALGANIDLPPKEVERIIEETGIGFMFAPNFHEAMKHAIGPRKEIGLRTVFNVLGPLTNPAGARAQVMGVYDPELTEKMASVLNKLGSKRAMVVHGLDGLDEISTFGKTRISKLENNTIETYTVEPEDYRISRSKPAEVAGTNAEGNAKALLRVLHGEKGPCRDIIQLNAAAAISVGGEANNLEEGIEIAGNSIDSGSALEKLRELVESTNGEIEKLEEMEGNY
ncbi:MAG: anthranilate phosphoribosyltransferase [Hadesarchaea archaeon]|nr:anthranilate phosphoribosyltransferase [Hadesarchaea archaeon]